MEEPKVDEPTPATQRGHVEDGEMSAEAGEVGELPNVDDSDMHDATIEFHKEVDEAMDENDPDEHDSEMIAIMDILQTLGMDVAEANRFSAKVVRAQAEASATFFEAYGTGRIVEDASGTLRNLNIKGLAAFDLRTRKEDGSPWDFS